MTKFTSRYSLLLFFMMAYGISWIGIVLSFGRDGLHIFQGENVLTGEFSRQLILIWLSMLAGPAISGIVLTAITAGREGIRKLIELIIKWRAPFRWYAVAILLFPATMLLIFYSLSFVSVRYYPSSVLMPGLLVGLVGGFFEEIGWTGFAAPRLLTRFNFIKTAIILGLLHSFWHFFADYLGGIAFYRELYFFHFFLWVIGLTALRFFIIWIYEHTRSVFLALLTHASFTGSQLILTPPQLNSQETILWYSIFVLVLTIPVMLIINSKLNSPFFQAKRSRT